MNRLESVPTVIKRNNNIPTIRRKYDKSLFLMMMPMIALIIAFNYVPIFGWIFAFFNYKPGIPLSDTPFEGFKYFKQIFDGVGGSALGPVLVNTFALSFLGILCTPIPVVFAILLSEIKNGTFKKIVQTTSTLPYFISFITVYALFFALFSSEGVYNQVLLFFNIEPSQIGLLGNIDAAWIFQTLVTLWKTLGWNAIIYFAAISSIDVELYDAAKIDGAGRFRVIMHVVVPGITATFVVLLLLNISFMLGNGFDQYFVFYNPLVADKLEVLDYYVYKVGILLSKYPLATALSAMKTIVSVIMLLIVNNIAKIIRGESIL